MFEEKKRNFVAWTIRTLLVARIFADVYLKEPPAELAKAQRDQIEMTNVKLCEINNVKRFSERHAPLIPADRRNSRPA